MGSRQSRRVDLGEAGVAAPATVVNLWLARLLQAGQAKELSWAHCDRLTAQHLGLSRDFWRRVRARGAEHPLALLLAERVSEIGGIEPDAGPGATGHQARPAPSPRTDLTPEAWTPEEAETVLMGVRGGLDLGQALALALIEPERWETALESSKKYVAAVRQAEAQWALEALGAIMRGERGGPALVQVLRGRGLLGGGKTKVASDTEGLASLGVEGLQGFLNA